MTHEQRPGKFDDAIPDDGETDTSMFDADEIVRSLEEVATARSNAAKDLACASRRRFEELQEQKRLAAELRDLDDYELDDSELDD